MTTKEKAKCPICRKLRVLVKDHCHETGEQRERICGQCNSGLGMFGDEPAIMRRAARYIEKHIRLDQELSVNPRMTPSMHRRMKELVNELRPAS